MRCQKYLQKRNDIIHNPFSWHCTQCLHYTQSLSHSLTGLGPDLLPQLQKEKVDRRETCVTTLAWRLYLNALHSYCYLYKANN